MTQLGGRQWAQVWAALSSALVSAVPAEVRDAEQHLSTDAIVAYVDGELSIAADARATRHLANCPMCTAEVAAQRQARAAVRSATPPAMPPSLLAALHAIPQSVDLPGRPDAVAENGEFLVAQRPPLGLGAPLGSGERLGSGPTLGSAARSRARWIRNSAGAVASGLVLGALAFAVTTEPTEPGVPRPGTGSGGSPVPAQFQFGPADREPVVRPVTVSASRPPQR